MYLKAVLAGRPVCPTNMGKHTNGAYNASLFLDEIDEALRIANPGKPGIRARRTLEALAFRQLAMCEQLHRQFKRRITRAVRTDETWTPDSDLMKAIDENGSLLVKVWKEIRLARKESQEAMKGLSEDELDRVSAAQLLRCARTMPDEQVHEFLCARFGIEVADVVMRKERA